MPQFQNDLGGDSKIGIQAVTIEKPFINQTFNQVYEGNSWKGKLSNIPRSASDNFTGRESLLAQLQACLVRKPNCEDGVDTRAVFVLFGLGGSGKTQVALKFAELHKSAFKARFWLSARNKESVRQSYSEIAGLNGLDKSPEAGKALLESTENWLLVIDNADDASVDLRDYLPPGDRGSILVTSRNPHHCHYATQNMDFRMDDMEVGDSIDLLLKSARKSASGDSYSKARELVGKLNQLPLAIALAGAAMRQNDSTVSAYLEEYYRNKQDIFTFYPDQGADSYGFPVFETWRISLRMMRAQNMEVAEAARDILSVCTHFHHEDIPKHLLRNALASAPKGSTGVFHRALRLLRSAPFPSLFLSPKSLDGLDHSACAKRIDDAILKLSSYSLIRLQNGLISMHALVQSWARYESIQSGPGASAQRWERLAALKALDRELDIEDTTEQHERRRSIYPHVRCFLEPEAETVDVEMPATIISKFARTAFDAGNFSMAESLYQKAFDSSRASFWFTWKGSEIWDLLDGLVSAEERQGHYKEAVENAEELVRGRTRYLGCNHLKTLQASAKLALAHQGTSNYSVARMINRSLLEKVCSLTSTEENEVFSAEVIKNHADVLYREGDYSDGVVLLRVALGLREKITGDAHPETLETMASLAEVLAKQNAWEEASHFASLTYRKRQRILGNTHPDTLSSLRALGNIWYHRREYTASMEAQERVLEARKRILGCQHPDTTTTYNELAKAQLAVGAYESAEANFRTALGGYEKQLGSQHHFLLITMLNLAVCLRHQGKLKESEELYVKTLAGFERRGDHNHPDALTCKSNLAVLLYDDGRFSDAETLQKDVLKAHQTVPGNAGVTISRSLQSLAYTVSMCRDRYEEADDMMKQAIEGLEVTLGSESHELLNYISQRANLLHRSKKYEQSLVLFRRACSTFKRLGIEDHWCFQGLLVLEKSMRKKGLEIPMEAFDNRPGSGEIGDLSQKRKLEIVQAKDSAEISAGPRKKQKREQEDITLPRWQTTVQRLLGSRINAET